jgi:hypothetical protein
VAPGVASAVAEYNAKHRQKSLLEQHAERQAAGKKQKKPKAGASDGSGKGVKRPAEEGDEEWVGKHPWRPFDRDKDLNAPHAAPKSAAALLKDGAGLAGRFSSGGR